MAWLNGWLWIIAGLVVALAELILPGWFLMGAGLAVLAMGLWGIAVIGWMHRPLVLWERACAMLASFTLIYAAPWSDAVGFALTAVAIAWLWVSRGRQAIA